jgi:phosphogluconate dehydratase
VHPIIAEVTNRIIERSRQTRGEYLERIRAAKARGTGRSSASCGNLAHAYAASTPADKLRLRSAASKNLGIVTAYNDMLSAHQPFETYPAMLREAAREIGCTAQVAGGVPAMCDGVTQGQPGMELSLFSRDVIAMATAVSLSHDMFDAAVMLGVCDKIVPGLLIGALAFGHLPIVFTPAGPMTTGISNKEKAKVREAFAKGEVGREALLESEMAAYHGPGTCTFYGTANSNQMLMETMGAHLPGSAFVTPGTELRAALTRAAAQSALKGEFGLGEIIDEKAVVNGIVGLMATGGSTNHTLHLIAMARAAGVIINWDDMAMISHAVPLLARIYPNGSADVNHFHAAGGMGFLMRELMDAGLLHEDVKTVAGPSLRAYAQEPFLTNSGLAWREAPTQSLDEDVLRPVSNPFSPEGGLKVLDGPLGRSVIKVSAVAADRHVIEAPAIVFADQADFLAAFKRGELERDLVAVVRFQGPKANGMPELHSLSPSLSVLQSKGFRVALVTDGRMSGASGSTPAAIHLTPEAADEGPIARIRDGDILRLDADAGRLEIKVDPTEFAAREPARMPAEKALANSFGFGRELFGGFRERVGSAEHGASAIF